MANNKKESKEAHLVDHVCQKALDLVRVQPLLTANADSSRKLGDRDSGAADRLRARLLGLIEATGDKHLAQKIAQGYISPALQRQVDPPLDKLGLALLQGEVVGVELSLLDAARERQEQPLKARVRL